MSRACGVAKSRRTACVLLAPLLLTACASGPPSSLPDYARPRAETMRPDEFTGTDLIPYRAVTRDDFRAARPPAHIGDDAKYMGAYTCGVIVPDGVPGARFDQRPDGSRVARLDPAGVHAAMDRECSWWNDEARLDPAYVLQHEQIHFALVEIEARKLTARLEALEVEARSPQQATRELQKSYDRMTKEAADSLVRESTRFDEETSFRHAPAVQDRWMATVEAQLGPAAAAPR